MFHKQAVHTNTVNSKAQHSQFDFCFRFLLLHILAQGEKIETVLFQPILAAYPTRHSWIISTHINLGTLNKPMHMFNRQKNIVRETISKLRNHPDDAIAPLQPLQVKLDNLHSLFMAYKPVFSSTMSILQTQPSFDGKPIPPSGRMKQSSTFLQFSTKMVNRNSNHQGYQAHKEKNLFSYQNTGKPTENNGTHCFHSELNPL